MSIYKSEAWGGALARGDTRKEAHASIKPHCSNLRERVYNLVKGVGGGTCDFVEVCTHLSHQTVSARIRELADAGRIRDSGERRKTRSGRSAIVWEAVK